MNASQPAQYEQQDARLAHVVGLLLRAGVVVSFALIVVAGAGALLGYGDAPGVVDPRGLATAGLLVLVATPFVRVLLTCATFVRRRDLHFVALNLIVLAALAASFFIGRATS